MKKDHRPKILLLDIETFPNLAWVWAMYEQNALAFEKEWIVAAFSAKWLDGKQITAALPDYVRYKTDDWSDRELLTHVWNLLDEADICVAHNGDAFDFKKLNARFIQAGLGPPSPYKTVDTLKTARRYFKFNSNKLNDLGVYLGLGEKVKHSGFSLWQGCMKGDEKSWRTMKKYNKQDVVLLERVYKKLLPWMNNHPNVNGLSDVNNGCPKCGSEKLQSRGTAVTKTLTYARYQCCDCGGWSRSAKRDKSKSSAAIVGV